MNASCNRMRMGAWLCVCLGLVCVDRAVAASTRTALARSKRQPLSLEERLLEVLKKIDRKDLTKRDLTQLKALLKQHRKVERVQRTGAARMARYNRMMCKQGIEALLHVLPHVLSKDQIAAWKKAQAAAHKEALAKHEQAVRLAKQEKRDPPAPPSELAAPLPAAAEWALSQDTADFTVTSASAPVHDGPYKVEHLYVKSNQGQTGPIHQPRSELTISCPVSIHPGRQVTNPPSSGWIAAASASASAGYFSPSGDMECAEFDWDPTY
jgi:hypothetical protein